MNPLFSSIINKFKSIGNKTNSSPSQSTPITPQTSKPAPSFSFNSGSPAGNSYASGSGKQVAQLSGQDKLSQDFDERKRNFENSEDNFSRAQKSRQASIVNKADDIGEIHSKVASSWIDDVVRKPDGTVEMDTNGRSYDFGDKMDTNEFISWASSPSLGRYFNKNVKGQYN